LKHSIENCGQIVADGDMVTIEQPIESRYRVLSDGIIADTLRLTV